MEISAATVMQLRNKTGLSMMECKKALVEATGNMEKAEDILRKSMKGKLDAKGDKPAGEGRVAIAMNAQGASIVELRANTDFTAKNDTFVHLTQKLADAALKAPVGTYTPAGAEAAAIDDIGDSGTGRACGGESRSTTGCRLTRRTHYTNRFASRAFGRRD